LHQHVYLGVHLFQTGGFFLIHIRGDVFAFAEVTKVIAWATVARICSK